MSYEQGGYIPYEEVLKKKEYYAKLFAEGNSSLENLLYYCFNNNIRTYKCCAGHYNEEGYYEGEPPYMAFHISCQDKMLVSQIVNAVEYLDGIIVYFTKEFDNEYIILDIISSYDNSFFSNIMKNLEALSDIEVDEAIDDILKKLSQFNFPPFSLTYEIIKCNGTVLYEEWVDYIKSSNSRILHALGINYYNREQLLQSKAYENDYLEKEKQRILARQ